MARGHRLRASGCLILGSVTSTDSPPLLAAADVLSSQLQGRLAHLSSFIKPHVAALDRSFRLRLRAKKYDQKQLKALSAITPGAAAKTARRRTALPADFFEQVEYSGRRLAKLNVPPAEIISALRIYDTVLDPLLKKLLPDEYTNFQWTREQLHFCVVLSLNNAFYQVREAETQAFYDLFRAELEAKNLDELLQQFLENLTRICQAQVGRLLLLDSKSEWQARAEVGAESEKSAGAWANKIGLNLLKQLVEDALHRARGGSREADSRSRLAGKYRSYWSVPLVAHGNMSGVIQLGFSTERSWLPRELQLLDAAVDQCLLAAEKARLMEDLAAREEQVRMLGEHMWQVEEEERRRISRELHDEAGQSMLCIRLQLEMLEKSLPPADGGCSRLSSWKQSMSPRRRSSRSGASSRR